MLHNLPRLAVAITVVVGMMLSVVGLAFSADASTVKPTYASGDNQNTFCFDVVDRLNADTSSSDADHVAQEDHMDDMDEMHIDAEHVDDDSHSVADHDNEDNHSDEMNENIDHLNTDDHMDGDVEHEDGDSHSVADHDNEDSHTDDPHTDADHIDTNDQSEADTHEDGDHVAQEDHMDDMHVHAEVPEAYADMENPLDVNEDNVRNGCLWFQIYCVTCHGNEGAGDGPTSIGLDPQPANLQDGAMLATVADNYLYWRISEGGLQAPFNSAMPPWQYSLQEQQIWEIIVFIRAMSETH